MSQHGTAIESPIAALADPRVADNVEYDPSFASLREHSADLETTTEYGSPSYVSDHRSRNADRTANALDHDFDAADYGHVQTAVDAAGDREMVCLDRQLGRHPDNTYVCRYYVPTEYSRIALAWAKLFEPAPADAEPDFVTVQIPDADEVAIRVLPEEGFTTVLGTDYTGEAKKSFLRLFMFDAKRQGGLGLHAGTKRVRLQSDDGESGDDADLETVGQVFLGLSGTGKSTLTAHDLGLEAPEDATMLQDDVCALREDGTVAGSEGEGLFIKTIGLDADEQPDLYEAATRESAVLDNVDVAEDGTVDFDSDAYTANGRAVVKREHLPSADEEIDLPSVDQVFFITRNPAMPPLAKLSPEEAAAAFMLGESVQTSAGDPDSAGEAIRVVGTNPFIVGSEGAEGNRFRDLVADLDADAYLLNTGTVGDRDIGVDDTVTLLRAVSRGRVEWADDPTTGLTVPGSVPGLDTSRFDVGDALDDADERIADLRAERREYLAEFEDLDEAIRNAVY
ncbi:phosphoenolpyruvate carboxykinase [Halosimplex carlsbadense 2-9-1]|uniref:phosphoenolpyruvate carboxykinase (ATP) n=1 Tax=Halosimplex carlsbadense 2-9-1 TaxID=797114 RepID=M0CNM9_9EURY|nr:phosphoenolpyruvate carboxykinase (ATP) [Halosimplex carlsbadense]ELZ24851.1 phosphoenolpyruvate carboxykinase [Halosimplex carlsbadense 2-9-1]